jgi:hypothetical protein
MNLNSLMELAGVPWKSSSSAMLLRVEREGRMREIYDSSYPKVTSSLR